MRARTLYLSLCAVIAAAVLGGGCGDDGSSGDDDPTPDAMDPDGDPEPDAPPPPSCGNGVLEAGEQCDDGGTADDNGCSATCTISDGPATTCRVVEPLASGTCEVTAGDAGRLVTGTILTPGKVWRGGQVLVDAAGDIVCTGCDCADEAGAATATVISCPTGVVSPGLINPHDHITFAQNDPYTDTGERYEHRHDWRRGQRGHTEISASGGASADQVRWGELRFVMGGATSTVGSGGQAGLLRNLDQDSNQEGLAEPPVNFDTFPLGDSGGAQLATGCGYPSPVTPGEIANDPAYFPHVSEGIDAESRNEYLCLSTPPNDVVVDKSAFIHSIALNASDLAAMAVESTSIIWSPRSNITLYGDTAPVTAADRLGVNIALGTDWMPTGSMNLLRELACADELNQRYYGGYFSDEELWRMVTINAAVAAAMDDRIGVIAVGREADLAIFDGADRVDHRAVLEAEPTDVVLVMRAGKPLFGDAAVVAAIASACDTVDVCGRDKRVCLMDEIGKTWSALEAANSTRYPAFECGLPDNEPSCVPTRPAGVNGSTVYTGAITAEDGDGDGIPDATDSCPDVFNPVRPVDDGAQADFDDDGEGDVCDVCPLDADATTCTPFDPDDVDGDGVTNLEDNCATVANPLQEDADDDDKGDACDACPDEANPGNAPCTVTIYDIKDGTVPVGSAVRIADALVTGRHGNGFFLQVKETDAGYVGADHSGIYVYNPGNAVVAGDRVTLSTATVSNFFGQIQLNNATVAVNASGEAAPAPIVVEPAEVATGGARAAALEGVLVRVETVAVTDIAPAVGPGDTAPTNEFVVDGLRVNDLLYLTSPLPTVGQNYASITGVLNYRNNNSKLEPRGAEDLVLGAATLIGFGPALSYVREGEIGTATIPTPLTVTLSYAPSADTFVTITSSDAGVAGAVGGGVTVLAGQTTATVLLDGPAAGTVTLTATLGSSLTADVRVVGAAEQPAVASLTPATATVPPDGVATFTVTLDLPAGAGGATVTLSQTGAAVTLPATVAVAEDTLTATFDVTGGSAPGTTTITATLNGSADATLEVAEVVGGLVINEVDYDMVDGDNAEYIEVYNGTGGPVALAGLAVVLINGANGDNVEYRRFDLADAGATLAAGQYLVIHSNNVTVAGGALTIGGLADNSVQNGAPDGIALIDTTAMTLIDALSYEGAMEDVTISGVTGTVDLVAGAATTVADSNTAVGSLGRIPNGSDTGDDVTDWVFTTTLTPGAANVAN